MKPEREKEIRELVVDRGDLASQQLLAEIDELRVENEHLNKLNDDSVTEFCEKVELLQREIDRLREVNGMLSTELTNRETNLNKTLEALEFYADENNHLYRRSGTNNFLEITIMEDDCGNKARKALAKIRGEK